MFVSAAMQRNTKMGDFVSTKWNVIELPVLHFWTLRRCFWVSCIAHPIYFQNVMSEAHQRPFALYFDQPSQREPSESANFFDLPEHRLHDRFASGVDGCPCFGLQFPAHAIDTRRSLRKRTTRAIGAVICNSRTHS